MPCVPQPRALVPLHMLAPHAPTPPNVAAPILTSCKRTDDIFRHVRVYVCVLMCVCVCVCVFMCVYSKLRAAQASTIQQE